MKIYKIRLFGIILFLITAFSSNVQAATIVESPAVTLRAEIIKLIQNPNLKINGIEEAEVKIQFKIGKNNEIEILKVDTNDAYLSEFLRKKLDNRKINIKDLRKDKVYFLKVRFVLR